MNEKGGVPRTLNKKRRKRWVEEITRRVKVGEGGRDREE